MSELATADHPFALRVLLRRLAGTAGAAGAAVLAGLVGCGLIATAALTLNQSDDRATDIREIRAVVSSGRELGQALDHALNQGPAAATRFASALETACTTGGPVSAYRPLLARLCALRQNGREPATAQEIAVIRAEVDRLAGQLDAEAQALIDGMALRSRNALLEIAGAVAAFAFAGLLAGVLLVQATHGYRNDVLRETIEALPAGVVLYDKKERLLMFNSLAAEISGARLAESIGKTYEELARETGRTLEAAGQGPQPVEAWVARFRAKNTRTTRRAPDGRWFDWSERQTPSGYTVGLRVDVSEKIRHERALEQARADYQSLVDSLSDIVVRVDFATGALIFASAAAAGFFGRPLEQLIGTHFIELVAPQDRSFVVDRARLNARSPGDLKDSARFRMIAAGGTPRHVEVHYSKTADENGQFVIAGVIRDIEERIRLERRLAEETARLRSIVESSGAMVALVDRHLDVVMVNSGFTAVAGIAADDAIGRPLSELIEGPLWDDLIEAWREQPGDGEPTRFAVKLGSAARGGAGGGPGGDRLVSLTATPVADADGHICNIVLLGVDETDWRRAEQALHDTERFATVGEMAGTMAHELSQPLQVINIACASAREELGDAMDRGEPADSDYMKQKLDRIAQQVDDASRIVGDLRAFVRGEADRQPTPFDPTPAIQRALKLTAHGMRQAGIAASLTLGERLPSVLGDVGRLEQVMVNLLNNARDAGGRKVEIVADATSLEGRTFLRIAVQDSGPGIPADLLPQLFVSFVTTKPRGTGTGLGLRICRRIIEEMGGSISATNRRQGGACFEVLLPASEEPQAQTIAA